MIKIDNLKVGSMLYHCFFASSVLIFMLVMLKKMMMLVAMHLAQSLYFGNLRRRLRPTSLGCTALRLHLNCTSSFKLHQAAFSITAFTKVDLPH